MIHQGNIYWQTTCSRRSLLSSFSVFTCILRGTPAPLCPLQDELQCVELVLPAAQLHARLPELRLQLEDLAQLLGHLCLRAPQLLLQQGRSPLTSGKPERRSNGKRSDVTGLVVKILTGQTTRKEFRYFVSKAPPPTASPPGLGWLPLLWLQLPGSFPFSGRRAPLAVGSSPAGP